MQKINSYHHKNLRKDIIEKGIELVGKNGVKELSIRKVAAACGVSHGAPYFHFKNKEELLSAMQQHISNEFSDVLEKTLEKYKEEGDLIKQLGLAYIGFFLENPSFFSFLYLQSDFPIDLSTTEEHQGFEPYVIFKQALSSVLINSACPKEKFEDIALALFAIVHGIASLATMKNINYSGNWKDKAPELLEVLACPYLVIQK